VISLIAQRTFQYIFVSVLLLSLTGCSSTHTVSTSPDSIDSNVSIGDNLIVTTAEGLEYEFILLDVDEGYLVGEDVRLAIKDIVKVERRVHEEGATRFTVFTVIFVILIVILSLQPVGMP